GPVTLVPMGWSALLQALQGDPRDARHGHGATIFRCIRVAAGGIRGRRRGARRAARRASAMMASCAVTIALRSAPATASGPAAVTAAAAGDATAGSGRVALRVRARGSLAGMRVSRQAPNLSVKGAF